MKRWQADSLLGLTGLIWGFGFVSQKVASAGLGPFTFVACRFLLSALFVLPFALREIAPLRHRPLFRNNDLLKIIALCASFVFGVSVQQYGTAATSATNAAFLSGLTVVFVPFAALLLFRQKLSWIISFGCLLSLAGVWLLTGVDLGHLLSTFNSGDACMLMCAFSFAFEVVLLADLLRSNPRPFAFSFLLYAVTGVVTLLLALGTEPLMLRVVADQWLPILYSGLLAGGIGYTLQAVAQQYTPSVHTAIIASGGETLFGALGAALLLQEKMTSAGYLGCAFILASIMVVEVAPELYTKLKTARA